MKATRLKILREKNRMDSSRKTKTNPSNIPRLNYVGRWNLENGLLPYSGKRVTFTSLKKKINFFLLLLKANFSSKIQAFLFSSIRFSLVAFTNSFRSHCVSRFSNHYYHLCSAFLRFIPILSQFFPHLFVFFSFHFCLLLLALMFNIRVRILVAIVQESYYLYFEIRSELKFFNISWLTSNHDTNQSCFAFCYRYREQSTEEDIVANLRSKSEKNLIVVVSPSGWTRMCLD